MGFSRRSADGNVEPPRKQDGQKKNTLFIEDETAGIDADLSKTLEGAMVSPERRRLKIGVPDEPG